MVEDMYIVCHTYSVPRGIFGTSARRDSGDYLCEPRSPSQKLVQQATEDVEGRVRCGSKHKRAAS